MDSTSNVVYTTKNMGIGTSDPNTKLQIWNSVIPSSGDTLISGKGKGAAECLRLQGAWSGKGSGSLLRFTNYIFNGTNPNNQEYNLGAIAGYDPDAQWGGGLCFYTVPNGTITGGDLQEQAVILPNGNMGIGTVIPNTKLQIWNSVIPSSGDTLISGKTKGAAECLRLQGAWEGKGSGSLIRFTNYISSGTNPNTQEYNLGAIAGYDPDSQWGGGLCFYTVPNGTITGGDLQEQAVILPNGNMGIGTTNPSQKLDVNGNINFTGNLYKNGSVLTLSNYSDSSTLVNNSTFVSNLYDKLHDNEINIYDTIKNGCSTVSFSLRGSEYTCSGSFITFDNSDLQYGLFMTAAHCVMEVNGTTVSITNELYVTNPITGDYTSVTINNIYYDGVADVALIRTGIDFSSNSSYPLQLSSVTPQTGDICFLCGNPGGLDNVSLSQGFIRDARFYENGGYQVPESLYIDTPGIGGNSGSPILNKNGKIIGIFTFGSSTTGMETFGGGANLSVLNSTLSVLKTQAINGSTNKRNTSKYYMGLDYWTQSNAPFTWKTYYGGATTFPNQGVRIYTVTSGISPFRNILGYLDILLSATIDGVEYKFGELSDQYPPGIMLYKPDNPTITIKYLDYSASYTEKTASVTLVTYASLGSFYAYLDAPLNTGASTRNPENVQQLCFPGKK